MLTPEDRVAARADGPLGPLLPSWLRSIRARDLSEETAQKYSTAGCLLDAWLAEHRTVQHIRQVTKADVEDFIISLHTAGNSPATVSNRYRSLQQFFGWAVEENEIDHSPMERMKAPQVPERPVPVLPEENLRILLKSLDGRDFLSRRDNAVLRLFLDTGLRRSELARIQVDDVDLNTRTVSVLGKGRRIRHVRFGSKTALAMDRYFRMRARQPTANLSGWWLAEKGRGAMTADGVYQMLVRRARAVGLDVHPHQLRHSWAHYFLAAGGNETDLMHNAGWKSRQMVTRYGRSTAEERAREAAGRLSLGDRL